MTGIPGALFELTPRDAAGTPLEIVFDNRGATTAGTILQLGWAVPNDRAFLVAVLAARAITDSPGGILKFEFRTFGAGTLNSMILGGFQPPTSGIVQLSPSNLIIPPNWILQCETTYGTGGTVSTLEFSAIGLLIPRGNFSLGGLRAL